MKTLFSLFLSFAKVGVMTFGGGYAMIPILEREIVEDKGWAESEELMDNVRELVRGVLCDTLDSGTTEWTQMKTNVKDALSKYLYSKTKRKPMILPVIMNV